MFITSLILFHF